MRPEELLRPMPEGLYCPPGDFFIDPVRPVDRALVTHGHSDHARAGHGAVLATQATLDIMAIRLGEDHCRTAQPAKFGERIGVGGVEVTFYPAGHVLGSAQIAVEHNGLRIVASGDYKRRPDPTAETFAPIPCDVFITEATFGLPIFRHPDPRAEIGKLLDSVRTMSDRTHLIGVYALGKAQRVARLLHDCGHNGPAYVHGALTALNELYRANGVELGDLRPVHDAPKAEFAGAIVLGPPMAFQTPWVRRFSEPLISFASGWMQIRARMRQLGVELPLAISDHCDWDELTQTIRDTGASQIWVTHGREEALVRWCELQGIPARPLHLVGYEDEAE